jgi:hypothetical protein
MAYLEVTGADDGVKTLVSNSLSGSEIVKVTGEFGGATIEIGYLDHSETFVVYTKCDGLPAAYTAGFEVEIRCGKAEDLSLNVSSSTGSTALQLLARSI